MASAHRVLVIKYKEKRLLGRHRHKWEDNIKIDLKEVELWYGHWIHLVENTFHWWSLANVVLNFEFFERQGIS
jgi:hypothetical protein